MPDTTIRKENQFLYRHHMMFVDGPRWNGDYDVNTGKILRLCGHGLSG